MLARIQAGGRAIACRRATTTREQAAILAQRFHVHRRRGYYRASLAADRDDCDNTAVYFLATLPDGKRGDLLLGSARVIAGESRAAFRLPAEQAFELALPPALRDTATALRTEVSRAAAMAVHGILMRPTLLALIQAIGEDARSRGAHSGLAVIKQWLQRALQGLGLAVHEIQPASVIYPEDGPFPRYFYDSDPVVPVYWLADEIGPSVERAIARYQNASD